MAEGALFRAPRCSNFFAQLDQANHGFDALGRRHSPSGFELGFIDARRKRVEDAILPRLVDRKPHAPSLGLGTVRDQREGSADDDEAGADEQECATESGDHELSNVVHGRSPWLPKLS